MHLKLTSQVFSSYLESIKIYINLMEIKMTYYHGPLDNHSCGQPWHYVLGSFVTPFQEKEAFEWTLLSLILTAVRMIIERVELKG
jgi:hypothetical protein